MGCAGDSGIQPVSCDLCVEGLQVACCVRRFPPRKDEQKVEEKSPPGLAMRIASRAGGDRRIPADFFVQYQRGGYDSQAKS